MDEENHLDIVLTHGSVVSTVSTVPYVSGTPCSSDFCFSRYGFGRFSPISSQRKKVRGRDHSVAFINS